MACVTKYIFLENPCLFCLHGRIFFIYQVLQNDTTFETSYMHSRMTKPFQIRNNRLKKESAPWSVCERERETERDRQRETDRERESSFKDYFFWNGRPFFVRFLPSMDLYQFIGYWAVLI